MSYARRPLTLRDAAGAASVPENTPLRRRTLTLTTAATTTLAAVLFTAVPPPTFGRDVAPRALPAAPRRTAPYDAALRGVRSPDAFDRVTAVRVLGALGDARAVPHLAGLRDDADPAVRRETAFALARLTRDVSVVRELAGQPVEDPRTAEALGACADPLAEADLRALAAPRDPHVRGAALRALSRRAPAAALPLVRDALGAEEAPLRWHALEAALVLGDASLAPPLRPLTRSADPAERRLAIAALARTGDSAGRAELLALASEAEASGDPWLQLLAAEALVRAGAAAGPGLWERSLARMDALERSVAVGRLRGGLPDLLRPAVRARLADPEPPVRLAAAVVLGMHGDGSGIDVLRRDAASADRATGAECAVVLAGLERR